MSCSSDYLGRVQVYKKVLKIPEERLDIVQFSVGPPSLILSKYVLKIFFFKKERDIQPFGLVVECY